MKTQRSDEDILDRIRKLLALATSPNVHEAALAAKRAAELLRDYELAAAAARDGTPTGDPITQIVLDTFGRTVQWKGVLADGAATTLGAFMFWAKGGTIRVFGRASTLRAVQVLYRYLVDAVDGLAEPTYLLQAEPRPARGPWKHSFRSGAAHVLRQRLAADRAEYDTASRATASSKALARVKADDDAVAAAYEASVEPTLDSGSLPQAPPSGQGYGAGLKVGATMGLSPQGV